MGLDLVYGKGQTPLTEEEKEGLLLKHISTQGELNEAEQLNIEEAVQWTLGRRLSVDAILSEEYLRALHKRMYREIWRWAGEFRRSEKTLGIEDWTQIPLELRKLIDDCKFWVEHKTFLEDETAVRFKHRIVSIHCFPNGNGRHSRLMADVIVKQVLGKDVFSWGEKTYTDRKQAREDYIIALKEADKENIAPLLQFARS
jgi:Fic-DOC domain mobile mystery protein B